MTEGDVVELGPPILPGSYIGTTEGTQYLEDIAAEPIKLEYEIDVPQAIADGKPVRAIVIPSGIAYPRSNQLVQALRDHFKGDHIVLTFDYSGLGEYGGKSTGAIQTHCLGQMVHDLRSVLKVFDEEKLKKIVSDLVVIGPSAGGNVVANVGEDERIAGIAAISTPTDFLSFREYFPHEGWDAEGFVSHTSKSTGAVKRFHRNLWEKSGDPQFNPLPVDRVKQPTLIVQGSDDTIVTEATSMKQNESPKSKTVVIPGDHNYTGSREQLFATIDAFLETLE